MKIILSFLSSIVFFSWSFAKTTATPTAAASAPSIQFSKSKLLEFKSFYDKNVKSGQPVVAAEQLFSHYKIKHQKCDLKKLSGQIEKCEKLSCYIPTKISNVSFLEEFKVDRPSKSTADAAAACYVSTADKKYIVPNDKLKFFASAFVAYRARPEYQPQMNEIVSKVLLETTWKQNEVVPLTEAQCSYQVTYQFQADLSGFTEDKTVPFVKPGVSVKSNGAHFATIVMLNGKSYRAVNASDATPRVYAGIMDYKLAPKSPELCTKNEAHILFELEKLQKLTRYFPIE